MMRRSLYAGSAMLLCSQSAIAATPLYVCQTAGCARDAAAAIAAEQAAALAAANAQAAATSAAGSIAAIANTVLGYGTTITSLSGSLTTLSAGLATETTRAEGAEAQRVLSSTLGAPGGPAQLSSVTGRVPAAQLTYLGVSTHRPIGTTDGSGTDASTGPCVVGGMEAVAAPGLAPEVYKADACATPGVPSTYGQAVWEYVPDPGAPLDAAAAAGWTGVHGWGAMKLSAGATAAMTDSDGASYTGTIGFSGDFADFRALDADLANHHVASSSLPNCGTLGSYCPPQLYLPTFFDQDPTSGDTKYNSAPTQGVFLANFSSESGSSYSGDTINFSSLAGTGTSVLGASISVAVTGTTPNNVDYTQTSQMSAMGEFAGTLGSSQTDSSISCGTHTCATNSQWSVTPYHQEPVWTQDNWVGPVARGAVLNSIPTSIGSQNYMARTIYVPSIPTSGSHTIILVMQHYNGGQGAGSGLYEFPGIPKAVLGTYSGHSISTADYIQSFATFSCPVTVTDSPGIFMVEYSGGASVAASSVSCRMNNNTVAGTVSGLIGTTTGLNIGPMNSILDSGRMELVAAIFAPSVPSAAQRDAVWASILYRTQFPTADTAVVGAACASRESGNGDTMGNSPVSMLGRYAPRPVDIYDACVSGQSMSNNGTASNGSGLARIPLAMQYRCDPTLRETVVLLSDGGNDIGTGSSLSTLEQAYISGVAEARASCARSDGALPHVVVLPPTVQCVYLFSGSSANLVELEGLYSWFNRSAYTPTASGGLGLTPGYDAISPDYLNPLLDPGVAVDGSGNVTVTESPFCVFPGGGTYALRNYPNTGTTDGQHYSPLLQRIYSAFRGAVLRSIIQ